MKKKLIGLALSAAMLFSVLSVPAFAAAPEESADPALTTEQTAAEEEDCFFTSSSTEEEKEPNSITYVALGDSICAGIGLTTVQYAHNLMGVDVSYNFKGYPETCYVGQVGKSLNLDRDHAINLGLPGVMSKDMVELVKNYNSGQFEITMKVMEPLFDSAFAMFQELGVFYEEKGYFGMSHSRIRRAEILLEFMRERKSEDTVLLMLEESLTFDLYYRENCKSRPSWAPSPAEFKEQTRYYCKNGVKSHVEPFHYRFPKKSKKALNEIPTRLKQPVYMLFDYENRDPLDHQAHVTEVTAVSMAEEAKSAGKAKLC